MKLVRTLLVLLAVPALSLTATLPAQAAQGFDLQTSRGGAHSGYAVGKGAVVFHNRHDFTVRLDEVADRCGDDPNGDGAGAYLYLLVRSGGSGGPSLIAKDASGCSDGIVDSDDGRYHFATHPVQEVRLWLRECDKQGVEIVCSNHQLDNDQSNWKDNPHV